MKDRRTTRLIETVEAVVATLSRAFPRGFRAEFGDEMAGVLAERLAAAEEQGARATVALGLQELAQLPAALLRAHLYRWRQKRQAGRGLFFSGQRLSPFGMPPAANDGRFSALQLCLESAPFLLAAGLILLLTYWPPAWLSPAWRDPLAMAVLWAGGLPLLPLLLGLARGMPRWAYPYGGLILGYTLLAAMEQRLAWFWGATVATAVCLAMMAALLQRGERLLPVVFRQLGASAALDWTRLSFGVFGAAPLLVLAAFDNGYLNDQTPYLALALLVIVLSVVVYGRSRRQDRQLVALLVGTTLLFVPALVDDLAWRGRAASPDWLATLWAGMVTLLLLPLLAVPLRGIPADRSGEESVG